MEEESYLEFYLGDKLILSGNASDIAKSQPDWDSDLKRGDKLTVNDEIRTILAMKLIFPEPPNEIVTIKISLE
jgi:hypothetical protein